MVTKLLRLGLGMLAMLLALVSSPVSAQGSDPLDTLTFNGFRFSYPSWLASTTTITHFLGDPVEQGAGAADAPSTRFTLYDPFPAEGEFDVVGTVKLYLLTDLAKYPYLQAQVDQVQKLLTEHPELQTFEVVKENVAENALPYVPVQTHGQVIRARAKYVENDQVRGISYVAINQAAREPFLTYDAYYTFQGVSADGKYYISATIPFSTTLFPAEMQGFDPAQFEKDAPAYYADAVKRLNEAVSDNFRPSMNVIESITNSMTFDK